VCHVDQHPRGPVVFGLLTDAQFTLCVHAGVYLLLAHAVVYARGPGRPGAAALVATAAYVVAWTVNSFHVCQALKVALADKTCNARHWNSVSGHVNFFLQLALAAHWIVVAAGHAPEHKGGGKKKHRCVHGVGEGVAGWGDDFVCLTPFFFFFFFSLIFLISPTPPPPNRSALHLARSHHPLPPLKRLLTRGFSTPASLLVVHLLVTEVLIAVCLYRTWVGGYHTLRQLALGAGLGVTSHLGFILALGSGKRGYV
jgi:hypothetical protein